MASRKKEMKKEDPLSLLPPARKRSRTTTTTSKSKNSAAATTTSTTDSHTSPEQPALLPLPPDSSNTTKATSTTTALTSTTPEDDPIEGCRICHQDDHHDQIILCDFCNGEYHLYCLDPPLSLVPEGDWYCELCQTANKPDEYSSESYSSNTQHNNHKVDDGLDPLVKALPESFVSRFGEIIWAHGGSGYGWWPGCIYDPRLTIKGARQEARKNLGKKHLVFFFECAEAPFAVLDDRKICTWEEGLAEDFHLGASRNTRSRIEDFKRAVQVARIEEGKPVHQRLDWNHPEKDILSPLIPPPNARTKEDPSRTQLAPKRIPFLETEESSTNPPKDVSTSTSQTNSTQEGKPTGRTTDSASKKRIRFKEASTNKSGATTNSSTTPNSSEPVKSRSKQPSTDKSGPVTTSSTAHNSSKPVKSRSKQSSNPAKRWFKEPSIPATTSSTAHNTSKPDRAAASTMISRPMKSKHVKRRSKEPPGPTTASSTTPNSSYPIKRQKTNEASKEVSSAFTEDDNSRGEALRSESLFCSVYVSNGKEKTTVGQDKPVGFVEIKNPKATFADLRVRIQAELAGLEIRSDWNWRFLLPTLGPVSLRQELTLGPIQPLLKQASSPPRDGSIPSPFKVFLVDAPKV